MSGDVAPTWRNRRSGERSVDETYDTYDPRAVGSEVMSSLVRWGLPALREKLDLLDAESGETPSKGESAGKG
jgi:hypothetical protein